MTIKEIINSTAKIVGRKDVVDYLNLGTQNSTDTLETVNKLVSLLNMIIGELAGTFIPMVKTETVTVTDGKIYFKDLNLQPLEILDVYEGEIPLKFIHYPEYIKVKGSTVTVKYSCVPPVYDIDSTVDYSETDISKTALIYGLCAEYCICSGAFDEAVLWHDRYVDCVKETRKIRNSKIKGRCWE